MLIQNNTSIPYYKSPFLEEDIQQIVKNLLEDNYFNHNYTIDLEENLSRIKGSKKTIIYNHFSMAFSIALDLFNIKENDTIIVSELFTSELNNIINIKKLKVIYLKYNINTLNIDISLLKEVVKTFNIKVIYLEFPLLYERDLLEHLSLNIPIILNDSPYWPSYNNLHKDILSYQKDNLICISQCSQGDFIHLAGNAGMLHIYSHLLLERYNNHPLKYLTA